MWAKKKTLNQAEKEILALEVEHFSLLHDKSENAYKNNNALKWMCGLEIKDIKILKNEECFEKSLL